MIINQNIWITYLTPFLILVLITCVLPKKFREKKNLVVIFLKNNWPTLVLSLLLIDLKPCKRESQCAQLRNLCTSIYFLYCTTCIHFDYEYCNSPLHFLFSFKLLFQNQNGFKITSQRSCVHRYIYSPPSSSIGKKPYDWACGAIARNVFCSKWSQMLKHDTS